VSDFLKELERRNEAAQSRKPAPGPSEDELLKQMPKGFKLARNLQKHLKQIAAHYKKTKELYTSDAQAAARRAVCAACDQMVRDKKHNNVMRCSLKSCGCYLEVVGDPSLMRGILKSKPDYVALHCDIGRWADADESCLTDVPTAGAFREAQVWFQGLDNSPNWNFAGLRNRLRREGLRVAQVPFTAAGDKIEPLVEQAGPDLRVVIAVGMDPAKTFKQKLNGKPVIVMMLENGWLSTRQHVTIDESGLLSDHSIPQTGGKKVTKEMLRLLDACRKHYFAKGKLVEGGEPYVFAPYRMYSSREHFRKYTGSRVLDLMEKLDGTPEEKHYKAFAEIVCQGFPETRVVLKLHAGVAKTEEKLAQFKKMLRPHMKEGDELLRAGDPFNLMRNAAAVCAISSNCLLEALVYNVPAVALGEGIFTGFNVVLDRKDTGDLSDVLNWKPDKTKVEKLLANLAYWQIDRNGNTRKNHPVIKRIVKLCRE